jgi:alpha-N-acetylglucosaminidase
MMLAWQGNPSPALIEAVDLRKVLIMDENLNRNRQHNPEVQYKGAPYLYNAIWDFGGRNTMGAHLQEFAARIPQLGMKSGTHMKGISFYNEGLDTDPAAFAFFTEMAWHSKPVNVGKWFSEYALSRYGKYDLHAERAWQILAMTAYRMPGDREDAHQSLFNLRPDLNAKPVWGGTKLAYDPAVFEHALPELLTVAPELRSSETYKYDLVNLTRQVMDNRAYALLPQIKAAYQIKDRKRFQDLSQRWLLLMKQEDRLLGTDRWFLLGTWIEAARSWAENPAEEAAFPFEVRSLLTSWGNRVSSQDLHDYANKDWSGLVGDLYSQRWQSYFDSLVEAMQTGTKPKPIDWYALEDTWNRKHSDLSLQPSGDVYTQASAIWKDLEAHPADWSKAAYIH